MGCECKGTYLNILQNVGTMGGEGEGGSMGWLTEHHVCKRVWGVVERVEVGEMIVERRIGRNIRRTGVFMCVEGINDSRLWCEKEIRCMIGLGLNKALSTGQGRMKGDILRSKEGAP